MGEVAVEQGGEALDEPARTTRRLVPALAVALLLIVLVSAATLELGIPSYGPHETLDALLHDTGRASLLVGDLRLPRLLCALMIGCMLGASGTVLQDVLGNPLAGPELLGVSAGGSAAVAAITVFGLSIPIATIPFVVLGVGFLVGMVVLWAAQLFSRPGHVALIGAAATAFFSAVVLGIVSLTPSGSGVQVRAIYRFMAGDLSTADWHGARILAPWLVLLVPLVALGGRMLNLLQLGEDIAAALGLHVRRARIGLFATAVGLTAPVVAVAGPIGFVALLAPHGARQLLRSSDSSRVLVLASLLGGLMTAVADLAARLALSPTELPVGLWTAIVGGPLLLVLLQRRSELT